jgi:hypothetical protein
VKQQCVDVCIELCQLPSDDETFLFRVITGDLAPCDFFLFPKMKLKLKVRRFVTIEEIQAESQRVMDTLSEKDFQEAFQKLRRWWNRCLHAEGNYFEGDGAQ